MLDKVVIVIISLYMPWNTAHWTVPNGVYADGTLPKKDDLVCAHRTIPLGSEVTLKKGRRKVNVVIRDRGPYGACICPAKNPTRDYSDNCPRGCRYTVDKIKLYGPHYRADFDCTPEVHRRLRTYGITKIKAVNKGKIRWSKISRKN